METKSSFISPCFAAAPIARLSMFQKKMKTRALLLPLGSSLLLLTAFCLKAIKDLTGGAKITNLSKEKDEGKVVFEAQFSAKGHVHEVTVDEKGKLVSDEKVIEISEAPAPVQKAIEHEAAGGKVEKLERIDEGGKVSFEALIATKGKRTEIKFDGKGKELGRENKGAKEND